MTETKSDRIISTAPATSPQRGILVVDDEPAVLQLLDLALRQSGFAVWQAANGQEALDVYQRHAAAIELVLLDVQMPGLDGPQTMKALKDQNPSIRCCFMSGSSGKYSHQDLVQLGALVVLSKPFDLGQVTHMLHQLAAPCQA